MKEYLETNWDYNAKELVEVFDELPLWAAPFGLKLLDGIQLKKGISVLDIGFGAGFPLCEIAMRLGESATVYGIDPWEGAIDRAKKKIKQYRIENIKIIKGVAEEIPLAENSIDLIVSNNGLNNVTNLDKALSGCSKVAKKGAQFIQTVNLNNTMKEFYSVYEQAIKELGLLGAKEAMHAQIYKQRKPLDELIALIEKNHFVVNSLVHESFKYRFVDGTALLKHYFIRLAFIDGWKGILPTEKVQEVFDRVEEKLNQQAKIAGGVTLSVPFVVIDSERK